MNKRLLAALAPALTAMLITGCATTTPAAVSQAPVAAYRDVIDLNGSLLVNYQKDGKPETLSGKFSWSQKGDLIDVSLASPFGQTLAQISVTPDSATLTQTDKVPRVAKDIDSLTAQTLGWSLPVSGLRDWLQGYATTPGGKRFTASPATNTVTTADGWRLTFVSWQDEAAAQPVPKRIDAERNATATTDELAIRIVIYPQG
ncbi:outer membrane lipoprotein LolB [Massilia cavernae]|uniref:Outer-membrane lipoprotein LolB n=1 Tax=Massilia cavernae TaxID=2320864 RepID=A0A418XR09_9BURK|nr:outer membrane lipoprotein LolB [Massilia cavernae]RJG14842.1 outer membrane lipoprotein LolB [Massilia cavernae]